MPLITNGETIRVLRKARGIRQVALAARVGCTPSHLCKIELGAYQPTVEMTARIADALGVSADAISMVIPEPAATA